VSERGRETERRWVTTPNTAREPGSRSSSSSSSSSVVVVVVAVERRRRYAALW
jgi:hypothetical protein